MAYEIPQQLQYKEKIVFGLTFPQIVGAIIFLIPILFILKMDLNDYLKSFYSGILICIGGAFMFLDLYSLIKNILHYFQNKNIPADSSKMNSLIDIRKIKDDVIHSHKKIAIFQVVPVNFNIKTDEEKISIISRFEKFLNGLQFPIQLLITSQNLELKQYFEELKKRVSNKEHYQEFEKFIYQNIENNSIRNRLFFIVVPETFDLTIQCKLIQENAENIGLKINRLNDKEILSSLKLFFNNNKQSNSEMAKDPLMFLIAPDKLIAHYNYFKINKDFCRIITADGYPRMVDSGFLDKLISLKDNFDISIHIEPYSLESTMVMLNKELEKQRADLYSDELNHKINPSLEIKFNDTKKVLDDIQKGNEKLFNVSLYINCKSNSKENLDLLSKKVESELNSLMIVPKIPYFRQINAYKSIIPIAKDELKIKRNITTKPLGAFFPFTSPFLTMELDGVMLGLNKNKVPYIKDLFNLHNANGIVLSMSGSGKSYFSKLLVARHFMSGVKILIVDPQSEYTGITKKYDGELITISKNSKTIINPLDLMGHDFIEKRLALMDLFKIMFGELSEVQKSVLDRAITETYSQKGIDKDHYLKKTPPILEDLYKVLVQMDKKAPVGERITYRALINRLYMYVHGVFNFMNRQSNLNFNKDFVCFNIGEMPKQVKPVVMFLILDYVYMKMKESKEKKLLVIDEAWSLLGHAEEASYIFEIVKTCRKFNLGLLLITQDVADLVASRAGQAVLSNSSYSLLLRQKPSVIDTMTKTFNLSQNEKEFLLSASKGNGILIVDNDHQEIEVIASQVEHELITTNPNEKINPIVAGNIKDVNIRLDVDKGLYYGSKLNEEEKNYLINHGYKVGYFVPIGKPRQEECWIKSNDVESLEHTFLVHNIYSEVKKYFPDAIINVVQKADIEFKDKSGKLIGIEVETGQGFEHKKKQLISKFNDVSKLYDFSFLVLTDTNNKRKYLSLNLKIPIIVRNDIPPLLQTLIFRKKNSIFSSRLGSAKRL